MMKTGGILKTRHNAVNETVELLVFGYQSKLYRDDVKALEFDRESHLIPAPYDNNVLLSRYDVRATLDVAPQENDNRNLNRLECLTQAEQQAEMMAEKERYHSLYINEVEEEIQQEELMKRQAAEYNAIPFNYDEIGPKVSSEALEEPEEVDTTPFESKLELPPDVEPPDTLKQHQIIEKTAKFIASQGPQMEILLKTKQASNSQFNFLSHDGKYNVYYKHILSLIKAGTYQFHAENETKKDEEDNQKEENGSVEEPQPSTSVIVIPKLAFKPSADCAYTQLISKITKAPISAIEQKQKEQEANTANGSTGIKSLGLLASYCSDSEDSQDDEEDSNYSGSIPSTEIQIVIDKTALYVAKNGRDFEETLRKKNDSRFQFLIPNDEFHAYYLFKVNESRKSLPSSAPATTVSATTKMDTKKTSESHVTETAKSKVPPAPVSFSIKPKDEKSQLRSKPFDETAKNANKSQSPNKISVEEELEMQVDVMNAEREERLAKEKLKGKLFDAARKNLVGMPKDKILQIERKKKALMFVNQIKGSHSNGGGNGNGNNEVINLTTGNDDDSDSSVKSIPISSSARGKRLSRSRSRKRSSRSSSSSRSRTSRSRSRSSYSSGSSRSRSRRRHKKSKSHRRKRSKHRRKTRSRSRSRSYSSRKKRSDRRDRRH